MKRIERLKARLVAAADQARRNPYFGLPSWADESVLAALRSRPIVCCGTGFWAQEFLLENRFYLRNFAS